MGVVPEAILPRPAVPLPPLDDLLGHVPVVKLESPLYVYSLAQEGEAGEQALPGRVQGLGVHRRGQSSFWDFPRRTEAGPNVEFCTQSPRPTTSSHCPSLFPLFLNPKSLLASG